MLRVPALLAVLAVAGHAGAVSAAQYCVADAAQLRSAITAVSGASGAAGNEIRILAGTHNVAVGASGDYALSLTLNTAPLTITGGWNAGCTQRNLIADASIISGNSTVRLMLIQALSQSAAELVIDGVSFRNGLSASGNIPSCLRIETDVDSAAEIALDRTSFRNCRASGSATGPALTVIVRDSFLRIRSSVFTDNAGAVGTISMSNLGGTIYFTGNTVAYNDDFAAVGGPAGLQVSQVGTGATWLVSNIIWGNGGAGSSDLFVNTNTAVFTSSNVFGVLAGDLGGVTQTGNLSSNPGFNAPTDLRLRSDSIARNSGATSAPGGYTSLDVFGDPRVQGGRVDRGAHEFGELFANSFE
jgi:hypothetical protein